MIFSIMHRDIILHGTMHPDTSTHTSHIIYIIMITMELDRTTLNILELDMFGFLKILPTLKYPT